MTGIAFSLASVFPIMTAAFIGDRRHISLSLSGRWPTVCVTFMYTKEHPYFDSVKWSYRITDGQKIISQSDRVSKFQLVSALALLRHCSKCVPLFTLLADCMSYRNLMGSFSVF